MYITESGLIKICFLGSVIGLVLLYFISTSLQAISLQIGKIDNSFSGKFVNVTGEVSGVKESKSGLFFNLVENESKIKVVLWNNILEQMELQGFDINKIKNGVKVNLIGLVDVYKNSLEIIPTKGQVEIVG